MRAVIVWCIFCFCLMGCEIAVPAESSSPKVINYRTTNEGGKDHLCMIKRDRPMNGATYCQWNYARGYRNGIMDTHKKNCRFKDDDKVECRGPDNHFLKEEPNIE